jgi:prephenate dehydrogenase
MWREILMENREALLPALRDLRGAADDVIEAMESGDHARLLAHLEKARRLRALRYSIPDNSH